MGARIVREGHICDKPSAAQHTLGTVAQCDCGRYWYLKPEGWVPLSVLDKILLGIADQAANGQRRQQIEGTQPADGASNG